MKAVAPIAKSPNNGTRDRLKTVSLQASRKSLSFRQVVVLIYCQAFTRGSSYIQQLFRKHYNSLLIVLDAGNALGGFFES